ncbi:MAG TPA: YfiR family protein [Silvibacterium sp.]|nr:YfiR family protein [Silvibacterium sp.]
MKLLGHARNSGSQEGSTKPGREIRLGSGEACSAALPDISERTYGKELQKNFGCRIGVRLVFALLGVFLAAASGYAQTVSEYDVEAAYLYNFGKFVRWPADAMDRSKSFDICVLGRDPFGDALEKLTTDDQVDGRPIRKRTIAHASDAAGCAIVYISDSESDNVERILAALNGKGELLVSALPNFAEDGGTIQFMMQDNRVRFEVNLDAAAKNRLALSSELLKVAVRVTGKRQSGGVR